MGRADDAAEQFDKLHAVLPPELLDVVLDRLPYRDEEPRQRLREALAAAGAT